VCEKSSRACGYHVYRIIWDAAIREDWVCKRDSDEHDGYAVAVAITKDGVIAEVIANHWPLTSKNHMIVLVVSEEELYIYQLKMYRMRSSVKDLKT